MAKTKACRVCKENFTPQRPMQVVCSPKCVYERIRSDEKKRKDAKKAVRELNRRDIRRQKKLTQTAFNKMRVLQELLWFKERGLEPVCISCEKPLGDDQWCCGHYKTVGAQSGLRYSEENTKLQHNRRCNMALSGDIHGTKTTPGYIQGIKNRFGEEEGGKMIDFCDSQTETVKWDWQELEKMRAKFNEESRKTEKLLL